MYDPQKHHRRSIRLKGYNYARPGAYFITLVTRLRENLFGQIADGEHHLSLLGLIVQEEWLRSARLRREIRLNEDEFIVMPNHIHGIVWIVDCGGEREGIEEGVRADGVRPIPDEEEGARRAPQPRLRPEPQPAPQSEPLVRADGVRPTPFYRLPRSLSSFIAGFKAAVTSRAGRELDIHGVWQRNYYEHIIRNERDFQRIWNYIDTNPQHWQEDQINPSAAPNRIGQN